MVQGVYLHMQHKIDKRLTIADGHYTNEGHKISLLGLFDPLRQTINFFLLRFNY